MSYCHGFFHDFLIRAFDVLVGSAVIDFFENFNDFVGDFLEVDIFIV